MTYNGSKKYGPNPERQNVLGQRTTVLFTGGLMSLFALPSSRYESIWLSYLESVRDEA
jgi:hypothetical protein